MVTMDEYIEQLLTEMPDNQSTLHDVVKNILDEPIPEAAKKRLLKPLQSRKYRPSPPPRNKKERKRKAIEDEFDPIPRQKSLRSVKEYQDEILDLAIKREGADILKDFLDPDEYYGLFVDDTPVLYPNGSYVKKGDTIVRKEIDEAVDGRPFDLRLVARGPDITDDGEVYWVSFENEDLRVTKAMGELVLELLDPDEQYKLFTVVGKAANEPLAPVTEEEGVSEHRIKGKTVVRGDQVSIGALHGIDQQIWEKGREYLVFTRYELRPLPEQKGEPGPMLAPEEDSEFVNCFVRYVVSHFQNRMTRTGSGLTPKRRRILEQFDKKLADTGCGQEDMFALETALKVKLVAVDALGNTLWDSGKYKTHMKVVVPCHNNHAWAEIPTDPPKIERVYPLDAQAEKALEGVVASFNNKGTAVQNALDQQTRGVMVAFAARVIPPTIRLWLCGRALVGSDGSLWRSRSASIAIDKAFEAETDWDPQDIPCSDYTAKRVFGDLRLGDEDSDIVWAQLKAHADRGWKGLPSAVGPFLETEEKEGMVSELMDVIRLETEYHKATHSMGGATAYRFGKWRDREEVKSTPEKYRAAWKAAQVEAKVWNCEDATAGVGEHHHLDMRAAYLGCEDSCMGDVMDLVREYGFPTSMMRRANIEGMSLGDVLTLTGAIRLSAWEFGHKTHPYTVGRVGEHLRENEGWITTPELRDLLDTGDLLEATAHEVVYSVGTKPGIRFPTDRDLAVRFVGKCARHGDESSILVRDPNEAAFLCNTLGGTDRLLNFEKAGDVHYIKYRDGKTRAQWFHIRAFVLAYTNVALRRMLRRFPQEEVLRVCTDAIYAKALPDEVEDMLVEDHPKYGQWRHKKPGYEWRPEAAAWRIELSGQLELPASNAPPLPSDFRAVTARRMYLAGQGGSGKTEWAVKTFAGRRLVVLTPENDLAGSHRDNPRLGLAPHQAQTIHHYLCISPTKPIEEWDPSALGHRLDGLAEVIVFDECCKVPAKTLKAILDYLARRTCQVICCGDRGQIPPWGDKEGPHAMLEEWAGPNVRQFNTDYRSLCEVCGEPWSVCADNQTCPEGPMSALHTVKEWMWCKSDSTQLRVFRDHIPAEPFEQAIQRTTPEDLWICSTNDLGGQVQTSLIRHHKANHPKLPAKIRFDPDGSIAHRYRKQGQPVAIPGSRKKVNAYKGTIVQVPLRIVEKGLPLEWKYAGWGTVHRVQGKTIQPPAKLFVVDHSLSGWVSNAVYTAVSRVRLMDQIVRVLPPGDVKGPLTPTALQATPSRTLIEARLKRYVIEDRQKGRPKYTGSHHKLTVDHVLGMIDAADKKCTVCGVDLLLQGYTKCHGQTFSIDRLDDSQGHCKWNVRLTCLSCNRRHKRVDPCEYIDPPDDGCQFW